MKIAITGASGYLGAELVPELLKRNASLLLVGRDKEKLAHQFPDIACCNYQEFETEAAGAGMVLHLAVINNDQNVSEAMAFSVNADFAADICRRAKAISIPEFVFISSTHALDISNTTIYARSKRRAVKLLATVPDIKKTVIYIPAVAGNQLTGKLSLLNHLPGFMRRQATTIVSALKPTVRPDQIADYLCNAVTTEMDDAEAIIISSDQGQNWVYGLIKASIDYIAALMIMLLFWWLLILIWVAVRLQSPGPGLFRQERVGRNATIFTCYKFRTMYVCAPNRGTHEVSASMVTPLGVLLRKTKLDELPQLINILLNQMSLVGPRPCLPAQTELIKERRSRGVFELKPGITGLAQINGVDMSEPVRLARLDERYVKLRSLLLDIKILVATVLGHGSGDRVKH